MNKLVVADVREAPEQVHRFDLRTGKFLPFWRGRAVPNQCVHGTFAALLRGLKRNGYLSHEGAKRHGAKYPIGAEFARLLERPNSFTGARTHITVNRAGVIAKAGQLPLGGL
jgi:hypothetical protein